MHRLRIEHLGLWTQDIEAMKSFYQQYFAARASARYVNPLKGFQSYFLEFSSGARLELMQRSDVVPCQNNAAEETFGYAHLAFKVDSEAEVDALTGRLRKAGYAVLDGPRRTGDGYYESVIADPEGNRIEITH